MTPKTAGSIALHRDRRYGLIAALVAKRLGRAILRKRLGETSGLR